VKRFQVGEWLKSSLLAVPALFVLGAVGLSALTLSLADHVPTPSFASVLFRGGSETAQTILSTIASSTVTLTGLVFSVTMLVLQLTSSRYSPRVLRTFLQDRTSKVTLGVFVGTFTYCMAVLRTINTQSDAQPGLATSVAMLLALATVAVFVNYINHIARRIRVSSIIESVARETDQVIENRFPEDGPDGPVGVEPDLPDGAVIHSRDKGVLLVVDVPALVECARRAGCQLDLLVRPGEFVPRGGPLFVVRPPAVAHDLLEDVEHHVTLGSERSMEGDPAYGFRQLVDIAEVSLSPAVNDPTTATQALDAVHDLLRRLARRPFPSGHHHDEDGTLRVRVPQTSWDAFLDLAVDEPLVYGAGSVQVTSKLRRMLEDLACAALPERRPAVRRKLVQLERASRSLPGGDDRA